ASPSQAKGIGNQQHQYRAGAWSRPDRQDNGQPRAPRQRLLQMPLRQLMYATAIGAICLHPAVSGKERFRRTAVSAPAAVQQAGAAYRQYGAHQRYQGKTDVFQMVRRTL